ncbi:MAG TPA: hypothetical protein VLC98_16215 [Phnomibacter sp.]|nr:hypothetical protein [Phnomibacter sp.]
MIWFILLGTMLVGILVIRYSYKLEKRKLDKDRKEAAEAMKEFTEMLNKEKNKEQ